MEQYYGLIELVAVFACLVVGWLVLERQGKRLDRARADRDKTDPR
ncbi:hypothetical protein BJ123_109146 [Rhodopseudomonas thermotolerans]|uniref:Uncharacterized protein n=2 Tax=Rhodopseudomonas TaxID=1073 RepID=A0A336JN99_9BRAD|nr:MULTISPECIES: hypothetical protein [Rhodopseudomonas]RED35302.1 hypothetical protein BJ125_109146 [Rhodopseudomonas pentothenatexigens]REG03145.1 hypothetical protein BJ123_109146 [Rhodopseudomonas thermotolerans]SSW90992.1 hypothetical protein SAMN05892882_109146 [Rhodopseudomonas pentothenatexigens]